MAPRGDPRGPAEGEPPPVGEYPGPEEVPTVAWPLLWRERLGRAWEGDRYRWWVLWTALAGLFASGVTITILAVAIPEIAEDLGSTETMVTWIVTGPFLAFALVMPVLGKAGDLFGHRRVYLIGFGAFAVFTGLSALAWDAPSLVVIRVLGGIAGAATGPASMALIMHAFPAHDRVKAMGWWSLVGAGAPVIGIVLGGPLVDALGWRALFVGQLPFAVVALAAAAVVLRETPTSSERVPLDLGGALTLGLATVPPLIALTLAETRGWADPVVVALLAVAPVGAVAWFVTERRARDPLVPLELFRRRNFTAPLAVNALTNFAYMGGFIVSPLLLQNVFGYTLSASGLVMMTRPLSYSITSPIAGYVAVRVGERRAIVVGVASVLASMLVLALAAVSSSVALVLVGLLLSGVGAGTSSPSLMSTVANAVEPGRLGLANATQQMAGLLGAVSGMQVLAAIRSGADRGGPFAVAYLVGAGVVAVGAVLAGAVRSERRPRPLEIVTAA